MKHILRIHVLPAQRGDALWVSYGPEAAPRHILIDGGITATGREQVLKRVAELGTPLHIELLVVTHIDLDHIQGVLAFLDALPEGVTFGDIWFNGWEQMKAIGLEPMGVKEGIRLSELLQREHQATWNKATQGRAVALDPADRPLTHRLAGDMDVTVLGPSHAQLARLRAHWDEVLEAFGAAEEAEAQGALPPGLEVDLPGLEAMGPIDVPSLAERPFKEDSTVPNGSSIALLLSFGGRRALMLGDAYPSVTAASLRQLTPQGRFHADLVKLAHHGSRNNTDRALAGLLSAPTWVFSSNGANNTKHPHPEAVARVLHDAEGVQTLVFNYRTGFNEQWDDEALREAYGYATRYGDGVSAVVALDVCFEAGG